MQRLLPGRHVRVFPPERVTSRNPADPAHNTVVGRLILLIIAVLALVWLLRRALLARHRQDPPDAAQGGSRDGSKGELVRCAHCQLHLPMGEARAADGHFYCSDEHQRLGPGRG